MDGAGFHKLRFTADWEHARKAEVADCDGEVVRMGTRQGEAGMEDIDAGEETGVAGEGGQSFDKLAGDQQGQPRRQGLAAGQPGIKPLAVEEFRNVIVGAFILAPFDDAQQMAVPEGSGELDEILEAGGITGALGRGNGDVELHELAVFVIEGEAGDFIRAPPDLDGGSLPVLADGVVAESLEGGHGGGAAGVGSQ